MPLFFEQTIVMNETICQMAYRSMHNPVLEWSWIQYCLGSVFGTVPLLYFTFHKLPEVFGRVTKVILSHSNNFTINSQKYMINKKINKINKFLCKNIYKIQILIWLMIAFIMIHNVFHSTMTVYHMVIFWKYNYFFCFKFDISTRKLAL